MRLLPCLLLVLAASPAVAQRGSVPSGCQEDYATCKEDCSIEYGGSSRTLKKLTQCLGICTENRSECSDRHSALRGLPSGVVADEPRPSRRPTSGRPASREEDPFGDADSETRRTTNREEDPFGDARPERSAERVGPRDAYRADTIPAEDTRPAREEVSPPVDTTPVPPVSRQGVYRAADSEPKPAPVSAPPPEIGDDLEPLDAPSPAPTASAKPAPRPEPVRPEPAKPAPTVASGNEGRKDPLLDEDDDNPPVTAAKKPTPAPSNPLRPAVPAEPKHDISDWDPNGD